LFIIGKQDRAVSLSDSLDQVHIPAQSHALFLDDCGHMGMIEHKQTSLKAIYAWLNTIYKFLGT
jgi:pimeloyl-ACP methyl ester carboxylesterase